MASLGVAANSPLYGLVVELVKAAGKEDEWELSKQVNRHHFHFRVENEGFMPLVVEAWNIGDGHIISVAHYWTCNGDAMRDPEVVMMDEGRILSFQQDPTIYHETAVREETPGGVAWKVNMRLYASVLSFTKMWARNIKAQGFIEAAKKVMV
jgi:hypothetical protein